MTPNLPPKADRELSRIAEREKAFYDELWSVREPKAIEEPLDMYRAIDLLGKRILICGCGTGVEAVRAARTGAHVYAFDISPVAVEKTRHLASFNSVEVNASVMDFHHLEYPDDFFDAAYGTSILHHVDCELAGRELYRVLKPGGIAHFLENSAANPLIMWVRRISFGGPGDRHPRQRFFLKRWGSADEDPLAADEIAMLRQIFSGCVTVGHTNFAFFRLIARHVWRNPVFARTMRWLDRSVAKVAPSLKKYSFNQSIWLRKPSAL